MGNWPVTERDRSHPHGLNQVADSNAQFIAAIVYYGLADTKVYDIEDYLILKPDPSVEPFAPPVLKSTPGVGNPVGNPCSGEPICGSLLRSLPGTDALKRVQAADFLPGRAEGKRASERATF